MIARQWRCLCPVRHREGFLEHLERTGVREARATPGYLGHQVLERTGEVCTRAGSVEIALITYWRDWEAIRAFAGPEPEAAVLYPGDERYGITPDRHVRHDEVLSEHWAQ